MHITIYHNPKCGTSRNTLAMIRHAGFEPTIIEYLKNPPTREELVQLIADAGISMREVMRNKETIFSELGLNDTGLSDEQLIDAMMAHPILINRPIVVSASSTKRSRPSEAVFDILPASAQGGTFTKEDGEVVQLK